MLSKNKKFSAIILANGKGQRFGGRKQDLKLGNYPLWQFVKRSIEKEFDEVIVVGVDIKGGKRRKDSVVCGLKAAKMPYVVIFDAVRPLVSLSQVRAIKKAVLRHKSVSFAYDPADTWYHDEIWLRKNWQALQVPQAFAREELLKAHENWGGDVTDDAFVYFQYFGVAPYLLKGSPFLHKVTYPEDYTIIKALWKLQRKQF